jgi:hypothetical protein
LYQEPLLAALWVELPTIAWDGWLANEFPGFVMLPVLLGFAARRCVPIPESIASKRAKDEQN